MQDIVSVSKVSKEFVMGDQKVGALHDVSFTVQSGEFMALAGSSGSGKTTLLNLIGGLDKPTFGNISIEGKPISQLSDDELSDFRRRKMGFVFQSFNLIPVLTALENVEYPLLRRSEVSNRERFAASQVALEKVGLVNHINKYPSQLSGGQKQRVAIARALVHKPLLVIADEPTANLDKTTGLEILALMSELNLREKVTFIFSTHDPKIIDRARRVISISDGRVLSDESKTSTAHDQKSKDKV
jgi:putative ABC transport system ATP-binding protein